MKRHLLCTLFSLLALHLSAQESRVALQGVVTYMSSRNVYVKFRSTKEIAIADTLYCADGAACLTVQNKSSISCISTPLVGKKLVVGDSLVAYVWRAESAKKEAAEKPKQVVQIPDNEPDTTASVAAPAKVYKPRTRYARARFSAASYNNFAEVEPTSTWRLTYQSNGALKQNERITIDHYLVYRRSYDATDTLLNRFGTAFKVYAMAVQWSLQNGASIAVGRKINARFASVGALDGVQYQRQFGKCVAAGAMLGSRPRLSDYAIDPLLMQGGIWVGLGKEQAVRQASVGVMEQRNGAQTDRRFVYAQYSDALGKKTSLFGSMEADLYRNVRDTIDLSPRLTNLYLMVRYRPSKKTDVSLAYDNRRNIIFYESYKLYIDQLIDNETRQGVRINLNYRPSKLWMAGLNGSMRFQKTDANQVKNGSLYVTCNQIPRIKSSLTLMATVLQTSYLDNTSYSARLAKSFWKGKLQAELNYRYLQYAYTNELANTNQHVYGINLSTILTKHLSLFFFAEQTHDLRSYNFTRLQTKCMYRF